MADMSDMNEYHVTVDPEGAEIDAMSELVDFDGATVLEVGCGDGRLTWRYAHRAASVVAIDPDLDKIALARASTPQHLRGTLRFLAQDVISLDVADGGFDIAILAHSL